MSMSNEIANIQPCWRRVWPSSIFFSLQNLQWTTCFFNCSEQFVIIITIILSFEWLQLQCGFLVGCGVFCSATVSIHFVSDPNNGHIPTYSMPTECFSQFEIDPKKSNAINRTHSLATIEVITNNNCFNFQFSRTMSQKIKFNWIRQ